MEHPLLGTAAAEATAALAFDEHKAGCDACRSVGPETGALCDEGMRLLRLRNELTAAVLHLHAFPQKWAAG